MSSFTIQCVIIRIAKKCELWVVANIKHSPHVRIFYFDQPENQYPSF